MLIVDRRVNLQAMCEDALDNYGALFEWLILLKVDKLLVSYFALLQILGSPNFCLLFLLACLLIALGNCSFVKVPLHDSLHFFHDQCKPGRLKPLGREQDG